MSKELKYIQIDSEDLCTAIGKIDYEFAGKLRAWFTNSGNGSLKIEPLGNVTAMYEEIEAL